MPLQENASGAAPTPIPLQRGERVLLRRPASSDEAEFLALNRRSTAVYGGWIHPPTQPEEFAMYLRRCEGDDYEGLLVCRREDGSILGAINFSQIVYGNFRSAYSGYFIGAPYHGRGYMTEAMRLALRHAFDALGLHRVEANIQPGNAASVALVKRLGFTKEGFSRRYLQVGGQWRDHERWAILADDEGVRNADCGVRNRE